MRIHTKTCPNAALICLRSFSTAGRLDPSSRICLMSIPAHSTSLMGLYGELCQDRIGTSIQVDTCSRRFQQCVSISTTSLRWLLCYWNILELGCIRESFQYVSVAIYPHNPFPSVMQGSSLEGDADVSITEALTHVSRCLISGSAHAAQVSYAFINEALHAGTIYGCWVLKRSWNSLLRGSSLPVVRSGRIHKFEQPDEQLRTLE